MNESATPSTAGTVCLVVSGLLRVYDLVDISAKSCRMKSEYDAKNDIAQTGEVRNAELHSIFRWGKEAEELAQA